MSETSAPARGPLDLLTRYHRAMLDMSADDLADLYAVDAVYGVPFCYPGFPDRFHGREEIRAGYRAAWGASPARVTEIRDVVVHESTEPGTIVVEQVVAGVVPGDNPSRPTHQPFAAANLLVMRVRDGLITELRDYLDALTLSRGLGRLPGDQMTVSDRT